LAERFPARGNDAGTMAGRPHGFRHYFCSMSADNKVPERMLMAWLGHSDSEMIRHYYHIQQNEANRQIDNIPFLGDLGENKHRPEDLADRGAKECG
jgi:integrase